VRDRAWPSRSSLRRRCGVQHRNRRKKRRKSSISSLKPRRIKERFRVTNSISIWRNRSCSLDLMQVTLRITLHRTKIFRKPRSWTPISKNKNIFPSSGWSTSCSVSRRLNMWHNVFSTLSQMWTWCLICSKVPIVSYLTFKMTSRDCQFVTVHKIRRGIALNYSSSRKNHQLKYSICKLRSRDTTRRSRLVRLTWWWYWRSSWWLTSMLKTTTSKRKQIRTSRTRLKFPLTLIGSLSCCQSSSPRSRRILKVKRTRRRSALT